MTTTILAPEIGPESPEIPDISRLHDSLHGGALTDSRRSAFVDVNTSARQGPKSQTGARSIR